MKINKNKNKLGFTLVELLVVIAIIGILSVISLASFTRVQLKARDAQRKSDLNAISNALMMYYNDYGLFPVLTSNELFGNISVGLTGDDGKVYMRQTPIDPKNEGDYTYVYKTYSENGVFNRFNLFANLENKDDSQCKDDGYDVDAKTYCYGISSPNTIVDPNQTNN